MNESRYCSSVVQEITLIFLLFKRVAETAGTLLLIQWIYKQTNTYKRK